MTRLVPRLSSRRSERGAVLVLAAAGMVLAMICASLAVDLGSLAQEARQDQKVADLAALDGVRALPADPTTAAIMSAERNGFECPDLDLADGCGMTVQWSDGISGVFTNDPLTSSLTLPLASVVRVTVKSPHSNDFPFTPGEQSVTRKGTATLGNGSGCTLPELCVRNDGSPIGTVRVGSNVASVTSSATIFNRLLTQTVGGAYSMDAVGYNGIAAGNVTFSRLKTELGFAGGSADTVLDTTFKYRKLLDATVNALNADGSPSNVFAATKLATIASQVSATAGADMTLRQFFDIEGNVGSGKDVADASMNVRDILVGGLTLADTDHFAAMTLTAGTGPGQIPGLPGNSVEVYFGLIEAPQTKSGPAKDGTGYRTTAHTGQIRIQVIVNLDVSVVGIGVLGVRLPYYLEIGAADASLDTLTCASGQAEPSNVKIWGTTHVGKTVVGEVGELSLKNTAATPVPVLNNIVNVLGITFKADSLAGVTVTLPGNGGTLKTFTPPYSASASPQHINATAFSLPTLTAANTTTTGGSLLNGLVETTLLSTISGLVPGLTTSLLEPIFKGLGISYAGADIWAPPPQNCNPVSFNDDPGGDVVIAVPSLVG